MQAAEGPALDEKTRLALKQTPPALPSAKST
jgi:hypothetical protein